MLEVPPAFLDVAYNGAHYPGAAGLNGLEMVWFSELKFLKTPTALTAGTSDPPH
jgi:hypothetical protein